MDELIVILGPTASGKTKLACQLSSLINSEIISADSRQVYSGMDIGTGKDLEEYIVNGQKVPYHLIDIKPAGYRYSIWEYKTDFIKAYSSIVSQEKIPVLCGGSGLYIETALKGNSFTGIDSDPDLRLELSEYSNEEIYNRWDKIPDFLKEKLDKNTVNRAIRGIEIANFVKEHPDWKPIEHPKFKYTIFGIDISRDKRRERITSRLSERLNGGLIEEVKTLVSNGIEYSELDAYGLEYKWVGQYLQENISKKELFEGLNTAIHQFSKRQMTWFRRMEKQGYRIIWIDETLSQDEKLNLIFRHLNENIS